MAGLEWVKMEDCFFDGKSVESGWMSLEDAKAKVLANPGELLGFCAQHGDNEDNLFINIVKIGTSKYNDEAAPFDCYVYKKALPTDNLFEDGFADDDWLRPGRGEGLQDDLRELCLFASVDPNDLGQGGLGDCWLISAMAALAEFPDAVTGLFDTKQLTDNGRYVVTLYSYEEQRKVSIEVDDRLPVDAGRKRNYLSYVKMTEEGELWPCLIEKAFAKYSGGYEELVGGQSVFAFGAMTGCTDLVWYNRQDDEWQILPATYTSNKIHEWTGACVTNTQSDEVMLDMLADFDAKNYLMCCSSHSGSDTDTNDSGIVQGHAYSLIAVKKNCAGKGFDLLCVRNPWGKSEWTGDWSDASELWDVYPDVAEECGHTKDDDGLFWISFDDFCENYGGIYVCKQNMGVSRGKQALAYNQMDYRSGHINSEDRLHKKSRGLEINRQKNSFPHTILSSCPIC